MSKLFTEQDQMVAWLDAEKAPSHQADMELSAYGRARALVASLQHALECSESREKAYAEGHTALRRDVEAWKRENVSLRWIIARNHGCPREAMYADDGEMSCNQRGCLIDFRRADAESLGRLLDRRWVSHRCHDCGGDPAAFCCLGPCPRDTNGDGNCGRPACPYCRRPA